MSYDQCMDAIDECGAPAVSIAGGEPLLHRDMPKIVQGYIAKKKFVILCTNALLMKKKIDDYKPSPYFTWSIHLDGDKGMHDHAVDQ
ncbi:radical SAM protein, partial [Escherichia coli]|uniref:radical SAM protein n=1 Tax=Escherichia coli TaxID=562 RepID=UPI003D36BDBC